ncbi:MAG TPA: putative Ig domain-containing protein, partial [Aquabacterium sp.]|nr:putative Ig domain-containing protein [Aquabacterium sp.]
SNTLQLRVADAAGNIGAVTSASYVLDTAAPTTSVTSVAFSADTGVSSTDFVTRTAAQTVSGTLSANLMAGDTVLVSLDNGATWTAAAASVGSSTWSLAGVTLASSDTLKVKVQDTAGNDGLVTSQAYVLDTTVATPSVDSVSTVSLSPVLSGQAALAAGETLTVTVGGATYALAPVGGVWHLDLATAVPSSGTLALALNNRYSVVATVTDPAGNTASGQGTLALSIAPIPMQPPVEVPQQAPQAQDSLPGPEVLAPTAPSPSFIAPHSLSGLQTLTGVLQERVSTLDSASLATTANFLAPHPSSPDSHDTLVAATPIADVTVRGGSRLSLQLPDDAFAHASGSGQITLSVAQADGRPLPNWLKFDPRTARFEGTPPPGFEGTLSFKVVARDAQGRIAVQVFKIVVTKEGQGLKGAHLDHGSAEPVGRASLAEQMRATRGGSVDRLAALSRHAPSVSSAA